MPPARKDTWLSVSFAVQFFNSYVYRGRINKGYLGGLDKVFKIRDRHHRIRRKILRKNEGILLLIKRGHIYIFIYLCARLAEKKISL